MEFRDHITFWREAFAWRGSITPVVIPEVIVFGLIATLVSIVGWIGERFFQVEIGLEIAPFEVAGAVLGLLLILRTNAGYDRWWEARKLWGGIVNQSRNFAIRALAYGPSDPKWQDLVVKWIAAFPHSARCSLQGERASKEMVSLVGKSATDEIDTSIHMPNYVALKLAERLREACEQHSMDRFVFLEMDRDRAALIDYIGACERILKTPLPLVYSIKIRRFIAIFLLTLPFAIMQRLSNDWLVPLITMLVAYPLISLDQIGIELQNPFAKRNLNHLPLEEISATIEKNLLGLLKEKQSARDRNAVDSPIG